MIKILMTCFLVLMITGCDSSAKTQSSTTLVEKTEMLPATSYKDILPKIGTTPMFLEFGASSCVPCITMGKILARIKREYPNSAVYFIEVSSDMPAARNHKIQMIPTQIYLNAEGSEVDRHIGEIGYEQLVAKLKSEKIIKE